MNQTTKNLAQKIMTILEDKKAEDVQLLDVSEMTVITEGFIVASGRVSVQVRALADHVEEGMRAEGLVPLRIEGYAAGRWIVIDYGCLIVHVFHTEEREFYNIERLWERV